MTARFVVANALELESLDEQYDTVLDSGLFHVFEDDDRARFVDSLRAVIPPDGRYYMLCFSDQQPGDWGPRRVTRDEIVSSFHDGWTVDSIVATKMDITIDPDGAIGWRATVTRT
jgi:cyclopropane fatty-acyl-phospholipid synthase-like methyltransferase